MQESQEVSPFQAGDNNAVRNRQGSMTRNTNNKKKTHPQKKHRLGMVSKEITVGFEHVWLYHVWSL